MRVRHFGAAGRGPGAVPNPGKRFLDAWPIFATVLFIIYLGASRRFPSTSDGPGDLRRPGRELVEPGPLQTTVVYSCPPAPDGVQGRARAGPGGAPQFCRLGLPPEAIGRGSGGSNSESEEGGSGGSGSSERKHKLAVLIPYRDRETHLSTLLSKLHPYLAAQGLEFDSFVIEQGDDYLFNRGALLNAGVKLLEGSRYDYFAFQDVDTIPRPGGNVSYSYPRGFAPLHLTPYGIHPKANYQDFFGGIVLFTSEQMREVNGFGTQFWGWGREDDNMRERLVRAGLWPPEHPLIPEWQQLQREGFKPAAVLASQQRYFQHQQHKQAAELRGQEINGSMVYFQELPRRPYNGAKIMSSQPELLNDYATGLNSTQFRVLAVRPFAEAVKYTVQLYCNTTATPWCLPASIGGQRPESVVKRGHAVHAVASGIT